MPNIMVAQPNIRGTICKSSIIPFLVPCCKVWLTSAAGVACSNVVNIGECKSWTKSEFCMWQNSVRGQEPPKMYIYIAYQPRRWPKIVQSLVGLQWATSLQLRSQEAKSIEICWDAQTDESISAVSGPCCLTRFLPIVDTCLSCEDIAGQSCVTVHRWRFFCVIFATFISSESHAAHFRPAF